MRVKQCPARPEPAEGHPPSEVAQIVLLLAAETAGNVTGTDVLIDGGMVTTT